MALSIRSAESEAPKRKLYKMKHRKVARLLDRTVVYEHNNRYRWNGCGAIAASESALVISWYTGGVKEPTEENLVVWSRSLDRGKAWSEPVEISNPNSYKDLRHGS